MRRKKKDKNNINNQEEIDLIPIESQQEETEVGTQPDAEPENPEATAEDTSDASLETETEVESIKTEAESAEPESSEVAAEDTSAQPETPEEESESSALFGAYVAEENKWERKNRIKDEKIKAKQEKKRAKYADVDDDTYEQMKAGGAHKFFGVLSLMMLIVGIAAVALFVYRLVIAPSYAQVGEKEKNLHVEGFASVLCIILCGAFIASLAFWIYRIGIFILCFALAFSAAGTLFPFEGDVQFFANVITGLIVGVLAVKYMRPVIILTSAIVCGTSAAGLLPGVTEYMGITTLSSLNSSAALTLALCVLGIAVQFLTTKEPVKKTVPRHKHG